MTTNNATFAVCSHTDARTGEVSEWGIEKPTDCPVCHPDDDFVIVDTPDGRFAALRFGRSTFHAYAIPARR